MRLFMSMILAVVFAMPAVGQYTNIYWTGGGNGSSWTDVNNWTNTEAWWQTSPRYPSTLNDVAWLGADETFVPDAPQNIHVDTAGIYIEEVEFRAQGNREITLTGEKLQMSGDWFYEVPSTATADVNIDLDLEWTIGGPYLELKSTNMVFRIGPDGSLSSDGEVRLRCVEGGLLRLEGTVDNKMVVYYNGASITFAPASSSSASAQNFEISADDAVFNVETNTWITSFVTVFGERDMSFVRTGPGDVTFRMNRNLNGGNDSNMVYMVHDVLDDGHFTLQLSWLDRPTIQTTTNSTVEFLDNAHLNHIRGQANNGIVGPGNMKISMPAAGTTFQVMRPLAYTGGTLVSTGILQLAIEAEDDPELLGSIGGLPATGMVTIYQDGTLDLNGIDDTIGALGGVGDVLLGGATLTIAEGVSPGLSVGAQTIDEAGAVILGGTSTFEVNATNVYDQVLIPAADLTLGGTLNVVVNGPFKDEYYGSYKIFELNTGTASGMFTDFEDNFNGHATCEIDANNDVIMTINRPPGTSIMVR